MLKLGKLVKDLSLAAMLLAELPGWLRSLRLRPARRVVLRLLLVLRMERVEAALCWENERSRGHDDGGSDVESIAQGVAGKVVVERMTQH